MGRWLGGIYGNTMSDKADKTVAKGTITLSNHYTMLREGGLGDPPPGTSQANPATHADAIAALQSKKVEHTAIC